MLSDTLSSTTRTYKALAHPARLRILAMLRGGELCACQITAVLRLAPSTVSAHMAELRRAGLLAERKDGRWVHYQLAETETAYQAVQPLWVQLADDLQIKEDSAILQQLRTVPVEQLCRVDLDLGQLAIARPGRG